MSAAVAPVKRDRQLLYASAFLRALATGMVGVLLGIYLAKVGLDATHIGIVIAAGLAGGAVATLLATLRGNHVGRRRLLITIALFGVGGAVAVMYATQPWVLAAAAFLGMVNGMGRDRGAALAIEQALLPTTAGDQERTKVVAWYNVLQDAGHALGSLFAGLPELLRHRGLAELDALRVPFAIYGVLILATLVLYLRLSPAVEAAPQARMIPVSPESRRIVLRISALFTIDALGGGFLTTALISYFFFKRFGVEEGVIGALFFGARVANALSHLGAAWLAKRIGLVNTMVFTHVPSSLLLATVAFAPTFPIAAVLFLLREGLVEMDVPTRTSYVMAVVKPEERLYASGVTSIVRMGAWAVAPSFAGLFMQGGSTGSMGMPLFIGSCLKITYDVLLYRAFKKLKPPEEREPVPAAP
jgi:MFS family permease